MRSSLFPIIFIIDPTWLTTRRDTTHQVLQEQVAVSDDETRRSRRRQHARAQLHELLRRQSVWRSSYHQFGGGLLQFHDGSTGQVLLYYGMLIFLNTFFLVI